MRGIGTAAILVGALHLATGLLLAVISVAADITPLEAARVMADARFAMGLGAALVLPGALLRVAVDMLEELRGLRAAAERSPAPVRDAAFIDRPALPPKPDWSDRASLPARIDMVARHGEAVGGRAWDLMRGGRRLGRTITEAEAVAIARRDVEASHG
jgi:hypothetical protein